MADSIDNMREANFNAWKEKHNKEVKKCICDTPNPSATNKNECFECRGEIYKDYLDKVRWAAEQNKIEEKEEEEYSPYCKVCEGCGEDGCCSAMHCKQSKDGSYCETYLNDLKFAYLMHKDTYDFLKDDEESQKKIDEIFNKNWDLIYKQDK